MEISRRTMVLMKTARNTWKSILKLLTVELSLVIKLWRIHTQTLNCSK